MGSLDFFFFLPRPPGGFKTRSIFNSVEIEKGDQSYKNLEIFLLQRPASVPQLFHFQVPEINASENESFQFRSSPLNEMCSQFLLRRNYFPLVKKTGFKCKNIAFLSS